MAPAMPKKRTSRRRYNLRLVRVSAGLAIGALAAVDVASGALTNTSANKYRVTSLKASWAVTDVTDGDDGQTFGIAHSDYSAAEIEECLEALGSIDLGDKTAQEQANRLVRTIGIMQKAGNGLSASFRNGAQVKVKLNWVIGIGDTLVLWCRNTSGVVYTTGAVLQCFGEMYVSDN